MTLHDFAKAVGDFLLAWQTLIAGLLALLGAWLTVRALQNQARQDAERKARAARVMLPATLDALILYSIDSVRWLDSIREKAVFSEKGAYKGAIAVNTPPRPDGGMMEKLHDCVEAVDIEHVRLLSDLVSKIQVQSARIRSLHDYLENYQLYEVKRFGLSAEIDDASVTSIKLVALCNGLFPYARLETDDVPAPIDYDAVRIAFRTCHLEEFKNVSVWNALTTPYLGQQRMAAPTPMTNGEYSNDPSEEMD